MSVALYLIRRAALRIKRRELRNAKDFLLWLEDQRISAEEGIRRYEAKAGRLEREIALLEEPGEIVRRAAA